MAKARSALSSAFRDSTGRDRSRRAVRGLRGSFHRRSATRPQHVPPRVLSAVVEFTFGDQPVSHAGSASRYETTWRDCSVPVAGPTACSIESTTLLASSSSSEWTTALTFTDRNRC